MKMASFGRVLIGVSTVVAVAVTNMSPARADYSARRAMSDYHKHFLEQQQMKEAQSEYKSNHESVSPGTALAVVGVYLVLKWMYEQNGSAAARK